MIRSKVEKYIEIVMLFLLLPIFIRISYSKEFYVVSETLFVYASPWRFSNIEDTLTVGMKVLENIRLNNNEVKEKFTEWIYIKNFIKERNGWVLRCGLAGENNFEKVEVFEENRIECYRGGNIEVYDIKKDGSYERALYSYDEEKGKMEKIEKTELIGQIYKENNVFLAKDRDGTKLFKIQEGRYVFLPYESDKYYYCRNKIKSNIKSDPVNKEDCIKFFYKILSDSAILYSQPSLASPILTKLTKGVIIDIGGITEKNDIYNRKPIKWCYAIVELTNNNGKSVLKGWILESSCERVLLDR